MTEYKWIALAVLMALGAMLGSVLDRDWAPAYTFLAWVAGAGLVLEAGNLVDRAIARADQREMESLSEKTEDPL